MLSPSRCLAKGEWRDGGKTAGQGKFNHRWRRNINAPPALCCSAAHLASGEVRPSVRLIVAASPVADRARPQDPSIIANICSVGRGRRSQTPFVRACCVLTSSEHSDLACVIHVVLEDAEEHHAHRIVAPCHRSVQCRDAQLPRSSNERRMPGVEVASARSQAALVTFSIEGQSVRGVISTGQAAQQDEVKVPREMENDFPHAMSSLERLSRWWSSHSGQLLIQSPRSQDSAREDPGPSATPRPLSIKFVSRQPLPQFAARLAP